MRKPKLVIDTVNVINRTATGAAAKQYREHKVVLQKDLASALEMHPPNLNNLESGKRKWSQELLSEYIACVDAIATKKGK